MRTQCLPEAKYFLRHALRTRGFTVTEEGYTFYVKTGVGKFALSFMPGNRRTLISHDVFIEEQHRGKGLGRVGLSTREKIAREAGATLLLATVRNDNKIELHLLRTSGWKRFTSRRDTGTSLWGKRL